MNDSRITHEKSGPPSDNAYTIVNTNDKISSDTSNNVSDSSEGVPTSRSHEETSYIPEQTFWTRLFSWRFLIVVLFHFSYVVNSSPLTTISMALVCMCGPILPRNDTLRVPGSISNATDVEGVLNTIHNGSFIQKKRYEFDWNSETRGLLLSSQVFGVFLVPHMANIIRSYIGNKLTLAIFALVMAFANFLAPIAARTGVYFLLATRVLTGLTMNANIPISSDTLAWWIPPQERLFSSTVVIAGWLVSGVLLPMFAGYFCVIPADNGWPFIFYFNATLLVLWTIAWYILSSRKPEKHPFISEKEKAYILARRVGMNQDSSKAGEKPPYAKILTSLPVLAYVLANLFHFWGTITIQVCLPMYLTSVLHFSLQQTGLIYAMMSIIRLPAMFMWPALGNFLLKRKFTTTKVRKLCMCVGQFLSCVLYLGTSFLDDRHKWLVAVLIIVAVYSNSFGMVLFAVLPLDMAPRYAGFLSGFASSIGNLASLTAPLLVAVLTPQGLYEEWRIVWIIVALVHLISGATFLIFGNASLQPWAVQAPKRYLTVINEEAEQQLTPEQRTDDVHFTFHKGKT